jgi:hypothetical protein
MISENYYYSPSTIRGFLDRAIKTVSDNIACYCNDPGISFTRKRKVNSADLMYYLIQLSDRSINSDLMYRYDSLAEMPSASAICQQRYKLDSIAMKRVFQLFTNGIENYQTYKDYYLLACDGSDINVCHNPKDKETYYVPTSATRGFNQLHLNALYDVLNHVFQDVYIDTARKTNECNSLEKMIQDRNYPDHSIIICDRGYEKYNLIAAFIESRQKFIIRVKEINSNGILSTLNLPDEEFDLPIRKIVTRINNTKTIKDGLYGVLMNNSPFDYFDYPSEYYEMNLRALRFKISEDTYECLLTNLTEEEMTSEEFKDIYHMRWNQESAFRDLKYTVGMLYFHSANQELIRQEIYASLVLYNYCQLITLNNPPDCKKKWRWRYKSNFKAAVSNIRRYMNDEIDEHELVLRIKKFLIPIRPGRSYSRNVRHQSAKTPSYYTA